MVASSDSSAVPAVNPGVVVRVVVVVGAGSRGDVVSVTVPVAVGDSVPSAVGVDVGWSVGVGEGVRVADGVGVGSSPQSLLSPSSFPSLSFPPLLPPEDAAAMVNECVTVRRRRTVTLRSEQCPRCAG